jgi:uncharacterized protein YjbI with pentapeptide repeats/energy-coupling factor transporter ATP-binding protein EcfA2
MDVGPLDISRPVGVISSMIEPRRALVKPRVSAAEGGETLLLEEEIQRLVREAIPGAVALLGPPGSGKSTALQHLAAVLPPDAGVALLDDARSEEVREAAREGLVVYTDMAKQAGAHRAAYRLAAWAQDDFIEYLLAGHKDRCASVMCRLRPTDRALFGGVPELWRIVLDCLAGDESIPGARQALHWHLETYLLDTDLLERARSACLSAVATASGDQLAALEKLAKPGFGRELVRTLRQPAVQQLLAAERIAADLRGEADCDCLALRLPRDLVKAAASLLADDPRAVDHLHRLLAAPPWSHAMAASLLHATGIGWVPKSEAPSSLTGAYLDGICWPGVVLAHANLSHADLSDADLREADLTNADVGNADLSRARLRRARLHSLYAVGAQLAHADLSSARAGQARFDRADLEGADLGDAELQGASFEGAPLTRAGFQGADLRQASLSEAEIAGADFSGADLRGACLAGLRLREANFRGAQFAGADLQGADLEYMDLPGADFENAVLNEALLTGSVIPGGNFTHAWLKGARLAEVDWEGAVLCGADLTGATFHMGSSRSGLVFSPIASEGSRTGFYTDDYDEQGYKAPEEIRKANLCIADLRGARLHGVDFYLVDLRGARCDPDQEEHFRRCGAILCSPGRPSS